ncbi:hypothetical protein BI198_01615 [Rheinheimera salexigens]|uniref:START domain-containing protein n=2 Tax=Rheinheimera salexigens TaxID=1628148 RepID=A0A1E7Q9N3_9GAMM|nr:hypothetical protein BI198_01615 [Rheinheimera salexigens]
MRVLLLVLQVLIMCWSLVAAANDSDWQLYKQTATVKVHFRQLDKARLEINAELQTQSKLGAFMHLLNDTPAITNWVDGAERAQVIAQVNPHSHVVHSYFSGFWPVSPRDMITQSIWSQDEISGVLSIDIIDRGQDYPAQKGYVRMEQVSGRWQLTPLTEGGVLIQYQGQADPAGKLPHFIGNKAALKASFNTFKNLEHILSRYQEPYPGINEKN